MDGVGQQHQCRDPGRLWELVLRSEMTPIQEQNLREGDTAETLLGRLEDSAGI